MLSTMSSRSTKGASKQRRENINNEISVIRELLPIQEQLRTRLSQLQVMSLCKAYIGKSNLISHVHDPTAENFLPFDFTHAIPGFLVMTDMKGRLFYVSDNVTDYLAHSMVDVMTQAETIYELVHSSDEAIFRAIYSSSGDHPSSPPSSSSSSPLSSSSSSPLSSLSSLAEDSSFTFPCRMGLHKHARRNPNFDRYKKMRIFGRKMLAGSKRAYFVALCTPCLNPMMASDPTFLFDTMIYKSNHTMDMKFVSVDHNGEHHLGYSNDELVSRSWYEMIHPEDIELAVNKHKELIQQVALEATCSLSVRMQSKTGEMLCLQIVMRRESSIELNSKESRIICWNQVVSSNEMGGEDKEELLHQLNTITYLEQYCSSQNSEKKVLYGGNGGVAKEKKFDRSELMEKLKRKMQKQEAEKNKMLKLEHTVESDGLKNAGMKFKNSPASMDYMGLLSEKTPPMNGNVLFANQFDLTNFNLKNGSSTSQLLQSPSSVDSFHSGGSFSSANNARSNQNIFNFANDVVTMPSPERLQTWSPTPKMNYLESSPASDDLNNQSFFPVIPGIRELKQEIIFQSIDDKGLSFPELNPKEVDDFFEKEAATFLTDMKDELLHLSPFYFDQLEGSPMFSEQFTQNLLQQLSAY